MAFVRACSVNEVPAGGMKRVKVNGEAVVVYNLADGFRATAASCPHVFGPMARGKILDGQRVQCPLHRAEFDIKTGEAVKWACFPPGVQLLNVVRGEKALKTYPVNVIDGMVYVEVA